MNANMRRPNAKYWNTEEYVLLSMDGISHLDNCVIFSQVDWTIVVIEDNDLCRATMQQMYQHGVPIILKLEGVSPVFEYVDGLFLEGLDLKEINRRRKAFIEERERRFSKKRHAE